MSLLFMDVVEKDCLWTWMPKIVHRKEKKLFPDFSQKQFLVPGSYYGGPGPLPGPEAVLWKTTKLSQNIKRPLMPYNELLFCSIIHLMGQCCPSAQMRVGCPHMATPTSLSQWRRSNIVTVGPTTRRHHHKPTNNSPSPIISQVRVMDQTSGAPAPTFMSEARKWKCFFANVSFECILILDQVHFYLFVQL